MSVRGYLANLAVAVVYALVFVACYVRYLNFYFDYAGYTLYPKGALVLAMSIAISVAPMLCYRGMRGISSFVSVFLYVLLYVPVVMTFSLASDYPLGVLAPLELVFMTGMGMLFLSDVAIIRSPLDFRGRTDLMPWVFALTALSSLYILFIYRSNLRFVGFGEALYEQRFANIELGQGLLTRYLSSWLSTVLIPLCLAFGLVSRRTRYVVVGTVSCVILYMATAAKIAILLPGVYGALFVLFRGGRLQRVFAILALSLVVVESALLLMPAATTSLTFMISSLLIMRTIGNGGQLTMAYVDFFATHPHTNYTHINFVRAIVGGYPYGNLGVGEAVGHFYLSDQTNANANFWATDGIAASGLAGVLLVSAMGMLVLALMNSVTRGYDRLFVSLCFLPFVLSLLNTSLFQSVWSGGAFFLILFFMFNRSGPTAAATA